ncbi:MAG TPA: immunoglobulin domain-containing protein, partial [Verrucomicrobiae bacterium]
MNLFKKFCHHFLFCLGLAALPVLAIPLTPAITVQPVSVVTNMGASVALSVTATGTSPLTYQWFKDGVRLSGQTNATLNLPSFQFTNSGSYQVFVTNLIGMA